jgi:hypothetical protein
MELQEKSRKVREVHRTEEVGGGRALGYTTPALSNKVSQIHFVQGTQACHRKS